MDLFLLRYDHECMNRNFFSEHLYKIFRELLMTSLILSVLGSILLLVIMGRRDAIYRLVDEKTEKPDDALNELQLTNEELEKFAYAASHDLKSPQRAVDNITKWLAEDLGDNLADVNKERIKTLEEPKELTPDINDFITPNKLNEYSLPAE